MFYIEKHKGVVDKLLGVCTSELERAALDRPTCNMIVSRLALELDKQARFSVDEQGNLAIAFKEINEAEIHKRLAELMAEDTPVRPVETAESEA